MNGITHLIIIIQFEISRREARILDKEDPIPSPPPRRSQPPSTKNVSLKKKPTSSWKRRYEARFDCKTCGKACRRAIILLEHIDICHTEESLKTLACDKCEKKFSHPKALKYHYRKTHVKPYICQHCPYRGTTPSALKE